MKKIKVFASFLKLADAKKEAQKQSKQLASGSYDYPNASVEILNAQQLWKTNNWTHKNPYGLPYPTENDYLICITYKVAQVAQPASKSIKPSSKKYTEIEAIVHQLLNIKIDKEQMETVLGRMIPFPNIQLHLPLDYLKLAS